jgi:membrane-anchored protein YejM (alkaline phosphatase superfamily)
MLTAATVRQNMVAGVTDQINFGHRDLGVELARSEDELLFSNAAALLQDESMDFVFLHFPLPHPPGVWDRKKGDWAGRGDPGYVSSYADNLVLADQELGSILAQLKLSERWPQTTVLVQGDHAWRVELWHDNPTWTAEDERNSRGGKFDDRPALMVHSPGQMEPRRVEKPTSLMAAHTMLLQAVRTGRPMGN